MNRMGIAIFVGAMSLIGVGASQENYTVEIETDRVPRMSHREVAQVVHSKLAIPVESLVPSDSGPQIETALPEITSMRLTTRDKVSRVTLRVPQGVRPTVRKQGFYLISDETGNVIGLG